MLAVGRGGSGDEQVQPVVATTGRNEEIRNYTGENVPWSTG